MTKSDEERKLGRADFDLANRIFFRLYQASNQMHRQGTRYVQDFGATTQQWGVLGALARPKVAAEGMTVKDLIGYLDVSRQNLGAVLDRLEDRGWTERVVDGVDARSRRIRMTPKGVEIWREMRAPIENFYVASLKSFSTEEQTMLYRLLDRLKTSLSEV